MLVLGLVTAGLVVVSLSLLALRAWLGRRRSDARARISEEEARENSAPLTTAIMSKSPARERERSNGGATRP
jgi:hypothetical protein